MEVKKLSEWKYWNEFTVKYQELVLEKYIDAQELPPYDDPILEELEIKLGNIVSQFGSGAFVKMSDRSPKDSATERNRMQIHLDEYLAPICLGPESSYLNNWVGLPAVYKAMMAALKVTSGKEALQLILVSFRTLEDLKERIQFSNEFWELEIVVREWREFNIMFEFRGFCCHNKFTALCQYYFDCYIEELEVNGEKIGSTIYEYWEKNIKDPLSEIFEGGYVIDFGYIPETKEVFVIELNPFDSSTDATCFSWASQGKMLRGESNTGFHMKVKCKDDKKIETGRKSNWWIKFIRDWKKNNNNNNNNNNKNDHSRLAGMD